MGYELLQRKALQNDLQSITVTVNSKSDELKQQQTFLSNLKPNIRSLFDQMKPLHAIMKFPSSMIYPKESHIDSLPKPLFAIYQSFVTQMHCNQQLDNQKIEIVVIPMAKKKKKN